VKPFPCFWSRQRSDKRDDIRPPISVFPPFLNSLGRHKPDTVLFLFLDIFSAVPAFLGCDTFPMTASFSFRARTSGFVDKHRTPTSFPSFPQPNAVRILFPFFTHLPRPPSKDAFAARFHRDARVPQQPPGSSAPPVPLGILRPLFLTTALSMRDRNHPTRPS